jgi:HSP20 family protein
MPPFFATPTDVMVQKDCYIVVMDLPGFSLEDIEMEIESSSLIINGTRRIDIWGNPDKFLIAERKAGHFSKVIKFPENIETRRLEFNYADGTLFILLNNPK